MGSFSSAARGLGISYQSAANHVRRLEQIYGTQLVEAERGSRRVSLTGPGRALHASLGTELETILARIDLLMRDVHSVMRVGVPQALFHHFFPRIVAEFRARHPDTELAFFERDTTLETMMQNGGLDACVSERYFGDPGISQVLLGEYRLALVYPVGWLKSYGDLSGIGDLRGRGFITYEPGQTIRARAQDFLNERFGAPPKVVTSASGSTSVMAMVNSGIGYAVVPEWVADAQGENTGKTVLDDLQRVKVYFGCSAFLERDALVADFRDACRNTMSADFAGVADRGQGIR
ncbi:MAG: LysR family transcriptional regulator [Rhodobacteraceae bacterium]|nr:LysR family transcriptional regulator [Paracoccaceae bacterium]